MLEQLVGVVVGAIGSLIAMYVASRFDAGKRFFRRLLGIPFALSRVLAEGGVQRMTLSRADYTRYRDGGGQLRDYLATAQHTIDIVSISLTVTQTEESLISFFEQRINENENFCVNITLLNPLSPVIPLVAKSLDIERHDLDGEIRSTLRQLVRCKERLPGGAARRLMVYVHDALPIGSAVLLDANPQSGRIQVESKLYRAPRTESFGFEIVGPSDFYTRNYTAWHKVFHDSDEWQEPLALPGTTSRPLISSEQSRSTIVSKDDKER
jgi:hypothetical protein